MDRNADMSDISGTFRGSTEEEAQLSSMLMVGAQRDGAYKLVGINQSIVVRFLALLDQFKIPQSPEMLSIKSDVAGASTQGVIKTIDINKRQGGIDFFDFNRGDNPPQAIVFAGVPKYPDDHRLDMYEGLSLSSSFTDLFSHSDYHHPEDSWYNFRTKIQELDPNFVFFAGGDDCLSWQEFMGPGYVALTGMENDNGMLVSRRYLNEMSAYYMSVESPLMGVIFSDDLVYAMQSDEKGVSFSSDQRLLGEDLWPVSLG